MQEILISLEIVSFILFCVAISCFLIAIFNYKKAIVALEEIIKIKDKQISLLEKKNEELNKNSLAVTYFKSPRA